MRFSIKIFICTMLLVAVAFSAGGYLLISNDFKHNVEREVSRALEEHLSLRFMLESGVISEELQNHELTDETLAGVAGQIASSFANERGSRKILVHDRLGIRIYPDAAETAAEPVKLNPLMTGQTKYSIAKAGGEYTITVTGLFDFDGTPLYLSYVRGITDVFRQKDAQLKEFMVFDAAIVVASAAVLFLVSWLLTRPVRKLSHVSRRIAGGEYGERADVRSSDEIGELTENFNRMADSVEEKINEMETASKRKDEFIANFTHELKTPMTSVIGYADMLRSKHFDNPDVFTAASYIFSEGRRLESLSLKMLDLILLDRQTPELRPVDCPELIEYVAGIMAAAFERDGVALAISAAPGMALAEPDLLKTLLINIADNARKASRPGMTVDLDGSMEGGRYVFRVSDRGRGIPETELGRITEAFYMVDKSRARAQHGAGLGLAIANRIAQLHGTELNFRSIVGLGTVVTIGIAACGAPEGGSADEE